MTSPKIQSESGEAISAQRGAILAEFAMVAPVILFLGLCCIEFARILAVDQYSATLSRQVAQTAVRQCLSQVVANSEGTGTRDCLMNGVAGRPNRVGELFSFAESLSPGSELIISVYVRRAPSSSATTSAYFTRLLRLQTHIQGAAVNLADSPDVSPGAASQFSYHSKFFLKPGPSVQYSPGKPAYQFDDHIPVSPPLTSSQQYLFVGEAYVKYHPLVGMVRYLFGQQDSRYDAALF